MFIGAKHHGKEEKAVKIRTLEGSGAVARHLAGCGDGLHIPPPSNTEPVFPRWARIEPLVEETGICMEKHFPRVPKVDPGIRAFDALREEMTM